MILWYCLIYTVFYFELADDIYSVPVFCTESYFYVLFLFICGVQQTCRHLRLNSNSSQSSLLRISGWANASSLDWIFFFKSWCLELPAWTSFLCIFSFLETLRFSNLIIDVLVMMTSRFLEIIVIELVFINEFKSSALFYDDITLKC